MSGDQVSTAGSSVVSDASLPNINESEAGVALADDSNKPVSEHSNTLGEIVVTSSDAKFKEELAAIESWFTVLSKPERTASIYTLLQNADLDQKQFFVEVLQQSIESDNGAQEKDADMKAKPFVRGVRPPSLDLPEIAVPAVAVLQGANKASEGNAQSAAPVGINVPGIGLVSPHLLNMAAASGASSEAQMLAIQLVMSGFAQPPNTSASPAPPKSSKKTGTWRLPGSAKYPGSALRHIAMRSAGLKSAGLKSAAPDSASTTEGGITPKEEDFDPEVLKDIPSWLRGLRLHKYTQCFDGMTWQEMVALGDGALEKKGIVTVGARRRLLRTFEIVRKKMGMEGPASATPTEGTMKIGEKEEDCSVGERKPPHSATGSVGHSKLSVNSPVFVPKSALPVN